MTKPPSFGKFADKVATTSGQPRVFVLACGVVLLWAASGPYFHFSDTWQLVINTSTTIVTFLMVFIIQNTQNRDSAAIQAKLNELIRASAARNDFIGIEHLPQEEVEKFRKLCESARAKGGSPVPKIEHSDASSRSGPAL